MDLIRKYEIPEKDIKIEQIQNLKETNFDYTFKILLIGDSNVGKSSLILKSVKNKFIEEFKSTIGFEFFYLRYKINNKNIQLQLWDTCGQERYHSLIKNIYKNSVLTIMVYSICDNNSFDNLEFWLKEIKIYSQPNIPVFLIGNKKDIEKERVVTEQQINDFIHENKIKFYFETSAATVENVDKLFEETVKQLYIKHVIPLIKNVNNVSLYSTDDNFVLSDSNKIDNDMVVIQEDNDEKCQNCVC
jgi:small GTP-binding protein